MDAVAAYNNLNEKSRDALVVEYAPLVKRIAHHLMGRLPQTVQVDDLIQAGMIGLLEAAKNYDPSKGATFETYAGIRIRGTMLDEVRRNDWLPRSVYKNSRLISEAVRIVENREGRDAKDFEVAKQLDMELSSYQQMLKDTSSGQLYGFDDLGVTDDILKSDRKSEHGEPDIQAQREDLYELLVSIIDQLPERERLVLSLYYDDELNLKEIGAVLGVSESRVCQIHSQAMHRIQARMPDWKKNN